MEVPLSRRELFQKAGQTCLFVALAGALDTTARADGARRSNAVRCINVVNFIRAVEPRFSMDLMLPVKNQMELIKAQGLPATWLLQYDALVSGPFVPFLKEQMAGNHEVGFWFEMNEKHCQAAGVEWRGRPGYEWDHIPCVAFTIGYTPAERVKLADTAMRTFKETWGRYPRSVASWNLDALTMAHLSEHYGIDAYAVCRDQVATDGFTIWGAPIAGYYPSKTNCWSAAVDKRNQIDTPVLRMLGQDPVYYYDLEVPLPNGQKIREPDTMEPAWTAGRTPSFMKTFLDMISEGPSLRFAYAQLGQENSFPWPQVAEGYPKQMADLAALRARGAVIVETMGDTGKRFKSTFRTTPPQAQVMLRDPFGNTAPEAKSVWYQSRFYRANLHVRGDLPYLRDLTVYSDRFEQPFLNSPTRDHEVAQKLPALMDGYHWRKDGADGPGSGAFFTLNGERARLSGPPRVNERADRLVAELPLEGGRTLTVTFGEDRMEARIAPDSAVLALSFEWDTTKFERPTVTDKRADFNWQGLAYHASVVRGKAEAAENGWTVTADGGTFVIRVAQV